MVATLTRLGAASNMDIFSTVAIAMGLAMDAFAVSIASGVKIKELKVRHAVQIALFFGVFQAIMPVVGWLAGIGLKNFISGFDHWVAFGLLAAIGLKMIYEALKLEPHERTMNPLELHILLLLSIATSLDALAVGVTLSFLRVSIVAPAIVIGAVTFALSLAGVFIGERNGHRFGSKVEVAGGLILIGIGLKILLEHTLY